MWRKYSMPTSVYKFIILLLELEFPLVTSVLLLTGKSPYWHDLPRRARRSLSYGAYSWAPCGYCNENDARRWVEELLTTLNYFLVFLFIYLFIYLSIYLFINLVRPLGYSLHGINTTIVKTNVCLLYFCFATTGDLKATGVVLPLNREIYKPLLTRLRAEGIQSQMTTTVLWEAK